MTDRLHAIDETLDAHVRYVHESALVPGTWVTACQYYGLVIRGRSAGAATVDEVADALRIVALRAATELERIQNEDPDVDSDRIERLWDRVACLVPKEAEVYEARITPKKPGLGLNAIFENAQASVGKHWWSDMKFDARITLICKSCGAPQQKTRDFICAYCGGDLFRRGGKDGR